MSSIIPLGKLFGGKSVRLTPPMPMGPKDEWFSSVRDIITVVCDQSNKRASETWINIGEEGKTELSEYLRNFKFPGRGQSVQPVISFKGCLKLLMKLPGETAKKVRSQFTDILTLFYAGDSSLHGEIEANSASSAPINQLAQEANAGGTGLMNGHDIVGMKRFRDLCEESANFQSLILSRQHLMVNLFSQEMALVTAKKELAGMEVTMQERELFKLDRISQIEKEKDERAVIRTERISQIEREKEERAVVRTERISQIEREKEERIAVIKLDLATKLAAIPSCGPAHIPIWTPSVPVNAPVNPKTVLELASGMAAWGQLTDDEKSRLVNKCGRAIISAPHNIPFMPDKVQEISPIGSYFAVNQFEQPYHSQITQALQGLLIKMRQEAPVIQHNSQRTINSFWNN